jgi:hypothetical protein
MYSLEFMGEDISLPLAFGLLALLIYSSSIMSIRLTGQKTPVVGLRSIFEHRLTANYNFFRNATGVINDGYAKVFEFSLCTQFRNVPLQISRRNEIKKKDKKIRKYSQSQKYQS